jgi:hypothetical protein
MHVGYAQYGSRLFFRMVTSIHKWAAREHLQIQKVMLA